ncbi:MAG: IclR family transcriptional regulator [Chloroflexota bacterium]
MSEVQTLARGLKIIDLLADAEDGLTAADLMSQLGIDKSGISRLMGTLVKYRYVDRDDQSRRYYLGTYIHGLGDRAGQHATLRDLVQPYLVRLSAQSNENSHVAVLSSSQALTIADQPSTEPLRVVSEVGRRMPLHCSAVGKCFLAFGEVDLPASFPRFTDKTLVDEQAVHQAVNQIREQEFALDDEELTLGVRGIAVPVRNREGRMVASLGISGPSVRLTLDSVPEWVELLQTVAGEISAELGYAG